MGYSRRIVFIRCQPLYHSLAVIRREGEVAM